MKTELSEDKMAMLEEASTKGPLGKAWIYTKLSGPGWLQGAITLGGGSLAGALYLGVLFGPHLMWLQPLAMLCGVIMLSAIAFITLSTGRRAFQTVNEDVSPVLGWAWLIATILANLVWVLPQFALGVAAIQQNLLPATDTSSGKWVIGIVLLVAAATIVYLYDKGGSGLKWFERLLKAMVGLIVLSFLGVVLVLAFKGGLDVPAFVAGHIPDFSTLFNPTPAFAAAIEQTSHPEQWREFVVSDQKDKIITAFGTAVGINMTFLLPSSILKKNWGKKARGLALFDLCIGLIIPFVIATGCLVIAAASQFHGKYEDVLQADGTVKAEMRAAYEKPLKAIQAKIGDPEGTTITDADRRIAAMLANRDTKQLAAALEPLTGSFLGQKIFGLGVLGMAFSTIIILMLINGFTVCEALNRPDDRKLHFLGALIPGIIGFFAPILWTGDSKTALAVPASVIGGSLIPIAYFTFFLLMNSRKTLGDEMPQGFRRMRWNGLMLFATGVATFGSVWVLAGKGVPGQIGIGILITLFILGLVGFARKQQKI